jgi:hypothetical protein
MRCVNSQQAPQRLTMAGYHYREAERQGMPGLAYCQLGMACLCLVLLDLLHAILFLHQ